MRRFHLCGKTPECLRNECADFALAFHEYTKGGGLHASGREAIAHFLPNNPREVIAHEPVKHASRLLGLPEVLVDRPRMFDRLFDGRFGDLVKNDTLGLFQAEDARNMPGDCLTLTVGVGGEKDGPRLFGEFLQLPDHLIFARGDLVVRYKTAFDVDGFFV